MTRPASDSPYRCPTPCDPDCELSGWGCHEAHDVPSHREHDAAACEALMLSGNLRWLLEAGWRVSLGRYPQPGDPVRPWYLQMVIVGDMRDMHYLDGISPGDLLARAVEQSQQEGIIAS